MHQGQQLQCLDLTPDVGFQPEVKQLKEKEEKDQLTDLTASRIAVANQLLSMFVLILTDLRTGANLVMHVKLFQEAICLLIYWNQLNAAPSLQKDAIMLRWFSSL